jgi:hypothetical protein
MHDRVQSFRNDLIANNLTANEPLAVSDLLRASTVRPTNDANFRLLVRRGNFVFSGLTANNSGLAVDAPFIFFLGGQKLRINLYFPQDIRIDFVVDPVDSSVTANFSSGVLLTFLDQVIVQGQPVPFFNPLSLNAITISDAVLAYDLTDAPPSSQGVRFELDLKSTREEYARYAPPKLHQSRPASERLIFDILDCGCSWHVYQIDTSTQVCGIIKGAYSPNPGATDLGEFASRDEAKAQLCQWILAARAGGASPCQDTNEDMSGTPCARK